VVVLQSEMSNDEMQETLLGILGYDDMDFLQDLLTHRNEIKRSLLQGQETKDLHDTEHRYKLEKQTDGLFGNGNIMDTIMDRETRHNRMMALAAQHKQLDKAKPQAIEYPHVYGAPSGGRILDAFGRKYALPLGTERHLEEVSASLKPIL